MIRLEFNGEQIPAEPGETLVQAARRHGSFVGFVCDGRGICQTCECRVLSGGENLDAVSAMERVVLGHSRIRGQYRLGCQARLVHPGRVAVVSRAEELRTRTRDVLGEYARGNLPVDGLQALGKETLGAAVDLVTGIGLAAPYALPQLFRYPPTPGRMAHYVLDAVRVAGRFWSHGGA
jgi:ferredoxin